jgi:hypothetical protein
MSSKGSRGQRRIERYAATETKPELKRLLGPRSLESTAPPFAAFLWNSEHAAAAAPSAAGTAAPAVAVAVQTSAGGAAWSPSPALLKLSLARRDARAAAGDADPAAAFHALKLSRALCHALGAAVGADFSSSIASPTDGEMPALPARVTRIIAPVSDADIVLQSCAMVAADAVVARGAAAPRVVWFVENAGHRDAALRVVADVLGVAAEGRIAIVSAGARGALDAGADVVLEAAAADAVSSSSSGAARGAGGVVLLVTAMSAARVVRQVAASLAALVAERLAAARASPSSPLSSAKAATLRSPVVPVQVIVVGHSDSAVRGFGVGAAASDARGGSPTPVASQRTDVGSSPPRDAAGANVVRAVDFSSSVAAPAVVAAASAPRSLLYAVVDGFGAFYALCRLVQNLSAGQRAVIHFATRHTATFFVDAFYALTGAGNSVLGRSAGGLTIVCDAEGVPKRNEVPAGTDYDGAVRAHVADAARRFTAARPDHAAVFVSAFGCVPPTQQLRSSSASTAASAASSAIFVQAETMPDVVLGAASLFLSRRSPLLDPRQFSTVLVFVTPGEQRAGFVEALTELVSGNGDSATSATATTTAAAGQRRERDAADNDAAPHASAAGPWTVQQLPLASILRATTDRQVQLAHMLEARELQSLVRKIFTLQTDAYEAFRSFCLMYHTSSFGRHIEVAVTAVRRLAAAGALVSNPSSGGNTFALGPRVVAWYERLQRAAGDATQIAALINLGALAHRFGLETPPLLDLRTADTQFRPSVDLYRFAATAAALQRREFREYAAEHLHHSPEVSDDDLEEVDTA